MKRMFTSATLKLTAWYLIILLAISILFSFIIFEISTSEISRRLERLQIRIEGSTETITLPGPVTLSDIRDNQTREAKASIFIGLAYMNLAVIGLGGIGSFLLARRTLQPIEEAHEAQSRFTSDASHELRTPLAIMKSEIQVAMREKNMTKKEYKALLESNLEEVDKLSQLSHSLLQLSRLDYGNVERSQRVNVVTAVEKAVRSLNISSRRIRLNSKDQTIIVEGNESMLLDLFQILLDNAMKYSPDDTQIIVTISSNGRTCKLAFTNEGEGIAHDDLSKVFDRFFRASKSRSSLIQPSGYGLGLSLAKKITTLHEGAISVDSEPGRMTTVYVNLPKIRRNR